MIECFYSVHKPLSSFPEPRHEGRQYIYMYIQNVCIANFGNRAREMAPAVKALATEPDDPSQIPRAHLVKKEDRLPGENSNLHLHSGGTHVPSPH